MAQCYVESTSDLHVLDEDNLGLRFSTLTSILQSNESCTLKEQYYK